MIKNNITILIITLFSVFLYLCQSLNDAIAGKKRSEQSDEFLVEKKNPLTQPPDFEKLPTPGGEEVSPEIFTDNEEIKELLSIEESKSNSDNSKSGSADIESSILEKIQ